MSKFATGLKSIRCGFGKVEDPLEKQRVWSIAVEAYPPYQDYQEKTNRVIPVFLAEPPGDLPILDNANVICSA